MGAVSLHLRLADVPGCLPDLLRGGPAGLRALTPVMEMHFPPPLPPGRHLTLPGRGATFIREIEGPPRAPTVLLLHGWIATADLNWWNVYAELGRSFHVVAMDHRGHGRGLRSSRPFRLTDCAGDAAAVVETLGLAPAVVVGYSMGGPVAQLTWRDHPTAVRGLVFCATSRHFPAGARERAIVGAIAYGLATSPPRMRHRALAYLLARAGRDDSYSEWLIDELRGHRMGDIIEAGHELRRFDSSAWIGSVDVPTSCLVMTHDDVVPPRRQYELARAIPGATIREIDGDHLACARRADLFVPALIAACREVVARGDQRLERGGAA